MNLWIFYVNEKRKDSQMADLNLCLCLCMWNREQRSIKRQRMCLWTKTLHMCMQCASVWVRVCADALLCVSVYLCLSHQLWNAIVYISNTRSCLFGRVSPPSWTLKQFLLSCDRWWDSVISVILCVKHLNCAFKARDFGQVIAQLILLVDNRINPRRNTIMFVLLSHLILAF